MLCTSDGPYVPSCVVPFLSKDSVRENQAIVLPVRIDSDISRGSLLTYLTRDKISTNRLLASLLSNLGEY